MIRSPWFERLLRNLEFESWRCMQKCARKLDTAGIVPERMFFANCQHTKVTLR